MNDYIKSIRDHNGKIIVRVDVDELLVAQPNHGESTDHYILICPCCAAEKGHNYSKTKLYLKKDKTIGFCQRCHAVYVPYIDTTSDEILLRWIPNFSKTTEFNEVVTIPKLYNGGIDYYNSANDLSNELVEHLKERRNYAVIKYLSELGFRCYNNDEIIIPFKFFGELIYYQINYRNPKGLKYLNPPIKHKPLYLPRQLPPGSDIVLCEGIYDAIALMEFYPQCTIAALLGCNITEYHIWMLRKLMPSRIYIFMDDTNLSRKVMKTLVSSKLTCFCGYSIIESDGKDPDELLKSYNDEYYNRQK
jgi:hypothetical protein